MGNAGFSDGYAHDLSFAISPQGQLYVSFEDDAHSYKASVMKYNGTNWTYAGSPGISAGGAGFTSLCFDHSGVLYLAYQDEAGT